jgi:hypothetical protein
VGLLVDLSASAPLHMRLIGQTLSGVLSAWARLPTRFWRVDDLEFDGSAD